MTDAAYMQHTCSIHAAYMQHTCSIHAAYMHYTCTEEQKGGVHKAGMDKGGMDKASMDKAAASGDTSLDHTHHKTATHAYSGTRHGGVATPTPATVIPYRSPPATALCSATHAAQPPGMCHDDTRHVQHVPAFMQQVWQEVGQEVTTVDHAADGLRSSSPHTPSCICLCLCWCICLCLYLWLCLCLRLCLCLWP